MHKKFEINWTKIKGSCHSGRKAATHDSKSDFPLGTYSKRFINFSFFSGGRGKINCKVETNVQGNAKPEVKMSSRRHLGNPSCLLWQYKTQWGLHILS